MEHYDNEIWKEAWDFPNYEVSNYGRIRNAKTQKVLKLAKDGNYYQMVRLYHNGKKYTKRLARLIWNSFNECNCPETIDHMDLNRSNDNITNLQCIPMSLNFKNRSKLKGKNKYELTNEKKKLIQEQYENGASFYYLSKEHQIPYNYIRTTLIRGSWKKYL